jgi:hypothetical protein
MLGRACKVTAFLFLLAQAAIPQDLPPEVLLLSRIKRHLRDELARTPNYTCLETLSRFRYDPKHMFQPHKGLAKEDTVRLEIVYTDGREWYGSPGAKNLSADNPSVFIGSGMIGNGAFALGLHNILEGGMFTYQGAETRDGRQSVKYDFRVPQLLHSLQISLPAAVGMVGEEGSIWVDPQSLDLIRVESHAIEIPPYLPLASADLNIDYARMRIGDADALLAQQADSSMLDGEGIDSYNRIEFTHCRSFTADSAITFDAKPDVSPEAISAPPVPSGSASAVPAFLEVTVLLTTPVSDADAVGALIEGRISGDVVYKGKVVAPNGSAVHGRIRRLEHYLDRGVFAVGLEFMDVDVRGEPVQFYADLLRLDKDPRIQPKLNREILVLRRTGVETSEESITLQELPGVASFFVKGAHFTLPSGFRMVWRTRGIIH